MFERLPRSRQDRGRRGGRQLECGVRRAARGRFLTFRHLSACRRARRRRVDGPRGDGVEGSNTSKNSSMRSTGVKRQSSCLRVGMAKSVRSNERRLVSALDGIAAGTRSRRAAPCDQCARPRARRCRRAARRSDARTAFGVVVHDHRAVLDVLARIDEIDAEHVEVTMLSPRAPWRIPNRTSKSRTATSWAPGMRARSAGSTTRSIVRCSMCSPGSTK